MADSTTQTAAAPAPSKVAGAAVASSDAGAGSATASAPAAPAPAVPAVAHVHTAPRHRASRGSSTSTAKGVAGTGAGAGAVGAGAGERGAAAPPSVPVKGASINVMGATLGDEAAMLLPPEPPAMTAAARRRRNRRRNREKRALAAAAAAAGAAVGPTPPSPPISPEDRIAADALKRTGNEKFMAKEFAEAVELYTQALVHDPTNKLLLGNRSAARRQLKDFNGALEDATAAVKVAPDWPKGYFRQAEVLLSLNRPRDAAVACSIAHRLDPKAAGITKQWHRCLRVADQVDRTITIESSEHWAQVFKHIQDKRLRLAVLAHFWNESEQPERFAVFHKFMEVVSASSNADVLAHFTPEHMIKLPLHNYEDIVIPDTWMRFFTALEADRKVAVFQQMWELCSGAEQNLIVKDFRFFFFRPGANAAAQAAAAAAAHS